MMTPRTKFDFIPDLTDLERWKSFLDEINIKYTIKTEYYDINADDKGDYIFLEIEPHFIDDRHLYYIQELTILFNIDESFKCFRCIGD